jgi:hypothetical protein
LNITTARCEALFASTVQRSAFPSRAEMLEAITQAVRLLGCRGCAAYMAQEFGDHPEAAVRRMSWAREQVGRLYDRRADLQAGDGRQVTLRPAA